VNSSGGVGLLGLRASGRGMGARGWVGYSLLAGSLPPFIPVPVFRLVPVLYIVCIVCLVGMVGMVGMVFCFAWGRGRGA
jgi:hypothetical protein